MSQDIVPAAWKDYNRPDLLAAVEDSLTKEPQPWQPTQVFKAFSLTSPNNLKAVLLGMDPYPTGGVPNGLAFSVSPDVEKVPQSLKNIFKEYQDDLGYPPPGNGDLTQWAENGCLLLNSALTCRVGEPGSHMKLWEPFSAHLLSEINRRHPKLIFILLGANARERMSEVKLLDQQVISAPHPSPLSAYRGFFGSRIFSKTNKALENMGQDPIDWRL